MRYLIAGFLLIALQSYGQALRDINYNYLYDTTPGVTLDTRINRTADGFTVHYALYWKDAVHTVSIQWETRTALSDKSGVPVSVEGETSRVGGVITGSVTVPASASVQLIVAKVIDENLKRAWLFYRILEPTYPVNAYLERNGKPVLKPFVRLGDQVLIQGQQGAGTVTYYKDAFPSASPPFAETQARVSKKLKADSIFSITYGEPVNFSKTGLYLVQKDTNSTEALTFRVEDDYPRLAKLESLAEPMIYVCTKQEFDKIRSAQGDKKVFDRVILGITGESGRARDFMRSYFRRVELANQYFSSYKEGWRTDRGMIFIIFGLPDEVFKFGDREVWRYKNEYKLNFTFAKSGTIFDPENFVLIRDQKFQESWYELIDLWRNARF